MKSHIFGGIRADAAPLSDARVIKQRGYLPWLHISTALSNIRPNQPKQRCVEYLNYEGSLGNQVAIGRANPDCEEVITK